MRKKMPKDFFMAAAHVAAPQLLGKTLAVVSSSGEIVRSLITEVEAYHGEDDLACHASRGRTRATEVLYGPGGHLYVYLCYGRHWMLNIVTGIRDTPSAVLIRGIEGISGPGRVSRAMGVDRFLHGKKLGHESGLWIEEGIEIALGNIEKTPRIGVAYAGEIWANKKWRFVLRS